MTTFDSSNPLSYMGIDNKTQPALIIADRAPTAADNTQNLGTRWLDKPNQAIYDHVGAGNWDSGGNAPATTTVAGIVIINTDGTLAGADNTTVPTALATKTYADNLAIAGAPDASTTVKGLVEVATDAEVVAGTGTGGTGAILSVSPSSLAGLFAAAPTIGGTTPAGATFTTLAATGAVDFDAGGSWESGGAAIDIAADASADAVNIGTGAAARTITMGNGTGATSLVLNCGTGALNIGTNAVAHTVTIGNVTGATAVALNAGTGGIALASTGTGDITINSDDTLLLDADGVLELNSSAGAISIGNDADAQAINIGTGAAARSMTIGNVTGATALVFSCGTGNYVVNGVGASTYNIGAATTTGTVTIGGTSQTGNFVLGPSDGAMTMAIANSDGAKTINVGNGVDGNTISVGNGINTSAQTVNIAGGASAANSTVNILSGNGSAGTQTLNMMTGTRAGAVNIGTGAAAHVIAVGSASAGAITVDTAAGISLDAATASNFTVTGAADLSIISTAGSVIVNGGEAAADAVRIVASDAAGGMDIDAGTAGIAIDTTGALSLDAAGNVNLTTSAGTLLLDCTGVLELNSSAGVISIGNDAVAQAINIGTGAAARTVTVGNTTGASALVLQAGTGDITVTGTVKEIDAEFLYSSGTDLVVSQSPIMQSNANTGVAPTGANGDVNLMYMQDGCLMEQFIIGTQTIIAPRMTANGLNIALDNTNAEGAEYNFGARSNAKHVYTIGTDAAFAAEATIYVEDISGCGPLMIGFRKVEANNATLASYTDYACIGINTATSATNATILTELNSGGQTATDTTDAWGGDTAAQTIKVLVSAAGVVTFEVGGSAASAAPAFTFDNTDEVMFFCHFLNGADVAGEVSLQNLKIGYQA